MISDLHLGLGSGADLLRRARFREPLAALGQVDRLVCSATCSSSATGRWEVLEAAGPRSRRSATRWPAASLIVPGNHDHLIEAWLERRTLAGEPALGLEQLGEPEGTAFEALAAHAAAATVRFAYPGIWLRDDVYAIHGHYLDRHLTVPTIERLGVALVERVLGLPTTGSDPLAPPDDEPDRIDEYERVQTPVYAFLFNLAQATVGERRAGANPRRGSGRCWAAATHARPGFEAGCWRGRGPWRCRGREPAGARPVRSDLSAGAIARAGFEAMAEVVERLGDRRRARDLRPHAPPRRRAGRPQPRSGTPAAGCTRRACSARPRR